VFRNVYIGEVSGPDSAAVLVASLRLGPVARGTRTHSAPIRVCRSGQHCACCWTRRCTELGATWPEGLQTYQQPISAIRAAGYVEPTIHRRTPGISRFASTSHSSVADK